MRAYDPDAYDAVWHTVASQSMNIEYQLLSFASRSSQVYPSSYSFLYSALFIPCESATTKTQGWGKKK